MQGLTNTEMTDLMVSNGYANDSQSHLRGMMQKKMKVSDDRLWLALKESQNFILDANSMDLKYQFAIEDGGERSIAFKRHIPGARLVPVWMKRKQSGWCFMGRYVFLEPVKEMHMVMKRGELYVTDHYRICVKHDDEITIP